MYPLFFVFASGALVALPIHFLSVEHAALQEKHGKDRGVRIGETYGLISGYLLFFSLIGLWLSPQPRFTLPLLQHPILRVPVFNLAAPLSHLIVFALCVSPGFWLLIQSVRGLSRKVSETHRAERVVTTGIYATIRHPQHLGWLLTHIGFSFLFSAWYALLATPLIAVMLYLISRKEEVELTKDFGEDYETYKTQVPMFIPRVRVNPTANLGDSDL